MSPIIKPKEKVLNRLLLR